MKFPAWIILIVGALLSFMVSFAEGSSETTFHLFSGLLFNVFVVSPYVFLLMRVQRASKQWLPQVILLLGSTGITVFGLAVYYQAFVVAVARDAQDAILFFMIPAIQWVCSMVLAGLARLFDRGASERRTVEGSAPDRVAEATAQTPSGTEA